MNLGAIQGRQHAIAALVQQRSLRKCFDPWAIWSVSQAEPKPDTLVPEIWAPSLTGWNGYPDSPPN